MSLLSEANATAYRLLKAASQGASLSLVSGFNRFIAYGEDAAKIAKVLGSRDYENGVLSIPTEDMSSALTKLTATYSVALLDIVSDSNSTRHVLVWKIPAKAVVHAEEASDTTENLSGALKTMLEAYTEIPEKPAVAERPLTMDDF